MQPAQERRQAPPLLEHCESYRLANGNTAKRQVLYLGEINDSQKAAWCNHCCTRRPLPGATQQIALFPNDRQPPEALSQDGSKPSPVQVDLSRMELRRPRQWGVLAHSADLEPVSSTNSSLRNCLPAAKAHHGIRSCNCSSAPDSSSLQANGMCSEWYRQSAMGDLLGMDPDIIPKNFPYHCHDKLLEHKSDLFRHLSARWQDLFDAKFEVLLYDLTSTYFESDPPEDPESSKKRFGYSRDKRPDEKILFPTSRRRDGIDSVEWRLPHYQYLLRIVKNPTYAGAFAWGRTTSRSEVIDGRSRKTDGHKLAMDEWQVLIKDHHPLYLLGSIRDKPADTQIESHQNASDQVIQERREKALLSRGAIAVHEGVDTTQRSVSRPGR
ncbi:MAG: hypothetical protein R3F19_23665 [Verrucomicrobiales bacterium]